MSKYIKLKITRVCAYKPSRYEYEKEGDRSELVVPLVCSDINNNNKKIVINVSGIDARFWVATDPYKMDISPISGLITRIEKHGKSYNEGFDLWRIHCRYPFQVPVVRDFFKSAGIWTGLADLPYERAFPIHYNLGRYIMVKELRSAIDIKDIIMIP